MSRRLYGSICVSDLVDLVHKRHSAFSKADNGKIYANVTGWLNDEKDKFGNIMAIQLSPKKDLREQDGQQYIGNMKEAEPKQVTSRDAESLSLPGDVPTNAKTFSGDNEPPVDDLPF